MGAAASVDFPFPADGSGETLELQAAANWHRIIKHANNGGGGEAAEAKADLSSQHISVSRSGQSLFQVFTPGATDPYTLLQEDFCPDTNIFRTAHRYDHMASDKEMGLKEGSMLYQQSERAPVQLRLARRSGSTVVLEWDGEKERQSMQSYIDVTDKVEEVRYEVIAGLGQGPLLHWDLLFSGALSPPSVAVRCPDCDTKYAFRCRRLIPCPVEGARGGAVSWLSGSWGPPISVRTGPAPPLPVTRATLLEVGCSSITVTWRSPGKDNGLPVIYYTFRLYTAPVRDSQTDHSEDSGWAEVHECRLDLYASSFAKPTTLRAPDAPLRPGHKYRLGISAGNRAGESAMSYVSFDTRRADELSLTPWVLWLNDRHEAYYKHLASDSVCTELPAGALLDEEMSFANKLSHFRSCVARRRLELQSDDPSTPTDEVVAPLMINRRTLVQDSLTLLGYCDPRDLELNPIRIQYEGEDGIDNGGVSKDWFSALGRAFLEPMCGIFSVSDGAVIEINKVKEDSMRGGAPVVTHLGSIPIVGLNSAAIDMYVAEEGADVDTYHSVGVFLGKSLVDGRTVGYNIDPILLQWMLHAVNRSVNSPVCSPPGMMELARADYRLYAGLEWVRTAPEADLVAAELTFSTSRSVAASDVQTDIVNLIPGGSAVLVDCSNRTQFIELLLAWLVKGRYEPALKSLLDGFRMVVPPDSLQHISIDELNAMFSGRPVVDLAALRKEAIYSGIKFSSSHDLAGWFWEVLESMDQRTLCNFLLFCTGSCYMPVSGYSPPFNVTMHDYSEDGKSDNDSRLPEAHTCFNQIIFPVYASKDILGKKLAYAVEHNGGTFSLL